VKAAAYVVWLLGQLYLLVLVVRLVIGLVMAFGNGWRPTGKGAAFAELVFMVTDPPIRFFRKIVRPLRVGTVVIDFGFMATALVVGGIVVMATVVANGY
jgi:YggT family protein